MPDSSFFTRRLIGRRLIRRLIMSSVAEKLFRNEKEPINMEKIFDLAKEAQNIGSILTRIAISDQGFLVLILAAASKTAYELSQEERKKLEEWREAVQTAAKEKGSAV